MRFLHGKAKASKGDKIRISVSRPTRILIMNSSNYRRYKNHQTFTYFGGQKEGTYEFTVQSTNIWNVIVEKGTYAQPIDIKVNIEIEKGVAKKRTAPRSIASTLDEADTLLNNDETSEESDEVEEG
ncbi:MAG: DUF1883 domain-containing protein [Cryomorphaceae bacterium]